MNVTYKIERTEKSLFKELLRLRIVPFLTPLGYGVFSIVVVLLICMLLAIVLLDAVIVLLGMDGIVRSIQIGYAMAIVDIILFAVWFVGLRLFARYYRNQRVKLGTHVIEYRLTDEGMASLQETRGSMLHGRVSPSDIVFIMML